MFKSVTRLNEFLSFIGVSELKVQDSNYLTGMERFGKCSSCIDRTLPRERPSLTKIPASAQFNLLNVRYCPQQPRLWYIL